MQISIPLLKRDIGLGGLVKKGLSSVGAKPCGGCKKREEKLDKALSFVPIPKGHDGR